MVRVTSLLVLCFVSVGYCQDKPHVTTPLGKVSGTTRTSHGGRKYSAFEGIPFAKPPIGERRFEEPEPVEPWSGVWEANHPTECAQTSMAHDIKCYKTADEDCLHVNVYVPRETPNPSDNLDVIVHIHGGAYLYCSAHFYTDPQFLMDHDVIFITFNYRVGILGFLSTEDDVVPGNNALKDQVLALKWIQENIASFGGNPDSVTLTGSSAGASSVHLHYFSDMSKGLFHRGYSHSGVALTGWSLQEEPLSKAKILAEAIGCPTPTSTELVQCLKQRPYHHILSKMPLFLEDIEILAIPFAPVVEKGSKPFLKADPYYLLRKGEVYDVPWITSNTLHEGFLLSAPFKQKLEILNDRWEDLAPFMFDYNYTLPRTEWKTAAKKIKEQYFGKNPINEENFLSLVQIFSDRFFLVDAETAIREQARVSKSPVYYYLFGYPGDNNEAKIVDHAVELRYIFGDKTGGKTLTDNELKMKNVYLNMLISFAKTGKPVIEGVNWEPTGHEKVTYLNVNGFEPEDIKLEYSDELTTRAFWKSLGLKESENLIVTKDEL